MENKTFRSRQSANVVAALALLGSLAVGLLYAGERQASDHAGPRLVAAVQAQSARSTPSSKSSPGERPIRINRPPLRTIKTEEGALFSAVAVDAIRDEIVLQNEATEQIHVYNRLDNTPPAARMTEPKRIIGGRNTKISQNCGVYVDPNTGDIYSIPGDADHILVFSHDAKGDVQPVRELKTPRRMFGIAVDEESQELFIATQWPAAVFVYRKGAEGREAPLRILEGDNTRLAGSMGIAVDTKSQVMYVANWGAASSLPEGMGWSGIPIYGEGEHRTWELISGLQFFFRKRFVPGSGRFDPPSILTFPLKASGNVSPERAIQGPNTQLDWPQHMSLDVEHQELYVANTMDNSVLVFRAADSGNVVPIRVLKGPKTEIDHPLGVYFDAKNQELVVSNWGNQRAVVFPQTANGNTAPIRRIRNAAEGTPSPMLTRLGSMAYDTKRDEILAQQ